MSLPNQFDIYLAKPRLRHSSDLRPVIVIEASQRGIVDVLPILSAFDLYDSSRHFLIQNVHPNFSATGLSRMSFLLSTLPLAIHIAVSAASKAPFSLNLRNGTACSRYANFL